MLVLTRRLGEMVYIGDNIIIKVAEINGQRVRLAIEAPDQIPVNRKEVHDRMVYALTQAKGEQ